MPLKMTMPHMEQTIRFKEIRGFFLIYFSLCLLLALVLFLPQYLAQRRSFFLQMETIQREEVGIHKAVMADMFSSITSDLMVLAHQQSLDRFIEKGDSVDLQPFGSLALSMARHKMAYDQIRFIDHRGMERIRIQSTGDAAFQVPLENLQNKAHRYYVEETRKLPLDCVYISPLDLNVENHIVERPFNPMLRIATPLYNTAGQYRGLVILNYKGKYFLERMRHTTPRRVIPINPHLINRKGYWLLSDQPEMEWGFMVKERSNFTFQNRFPQAWEKAIAHGESGQVMTQKGLFSFTTFYPVRECSTFLKQGSPDFKATFMEGPDPLTWKIIYHTPRANIQAGLRSQNFRLVFMLILFIGVGTLVSWVAARHVVIRRKDRRLHKRFFILKDGLLQSTRLHSGSLDLEKMLTQVLESTKDLIKARYAAIGLTGDGEEIIEFFSVGFSLDTRQAIPRCPPRFGLIRALLQEKKSILVKDMTRDPRFQGFPHTHPPMNSFLGTPIFYKNRLLGAIYLSNSEYPKGFTSQDLQLMEVFAAHIAVEINTMQLYRQIKQANEVLEERVITRTQSLSQANDQLKQEILHREKVDKALYKSEARFRSTFQQAAVGIAHVSPEGKFIRINERLCQIWGYGLRELIQKNFQEITHSEDLNADLDLVQQVIDGKISRYSMEKRYISKNGYPVWCNLTVSLLRNSDGTPRYFISVVEDISQRKKAEERLLSAKIEAEKANIAKSNFLASMGHELRTPLNAVIGFSEVLLDQFFGPLNPQQAEYVNDILHSGRHLLTLINDILDLSKVEAGWMRFLPVPTPLDSVMGESLKTIGPMIKEKQIRLIRDLPKEFSKIHLHSDPVKLKQIFNHLLSNAAKFTPKGGTITITGKIVSDVCLPSNMALKDTPLPDSLRTCTQPGVPGVEICIRDTGTGLTSGHSDKIFESFFQVEGGISDKSPGTGLGLSLARRFVEMHKGRIWVHSDGLGKGSCFYFTIPLALDEESLHPEEQLSKTQKESKQ
ncbi:sensory box histidine kinase (GGDEF domain protein) [Desulforapulum autotrophicum HRM2]|uniref:histidine kinase n=2 Tax=Desulforapulum autotrophicum TaxID=2296 RepID=C0QM98_DESAH|nr:sensory box histidine kinase (GGDEF domain protein) [Desulforapulum autotrophicum HRM2]